MIANYKNSREEVINELESLLLECKETEKIAAKSSVKSDISTQRYLKIKGSILGIEEALNKLKEI